METELLREWKKKLAPRLSAITGVNGIGIGLIGLKINIEQESKKVRDAIDDVFEQECPDVPFVVKVVGKITKQKA